MSRNIQRNKGFSVVELIVIISLFSIMSSVVFFDFNTFKEKIDRANLTTDLALAFRQMQVYGISASNREIGRAGFTDNVGNIEVAVNADLILDTSSYGIVVDFDSQVVTQYKESGGSSSSFSSADEIVDVLSIQGDSNILYACVGYENGTPLILADGSGCDFEGILGERVDSGDITIMFNRPFPDASFSSSEFSLGSDPTVIIFVIGEEGVGVDDLDFLYIDQVGLIQIANDNIIS